MSGLDHFLGHLKRKVRILVAMTIAFFVVGLFGLAESAAHRGLDTLSAAAFIMGAVTAFVALDGTLTTHKVERLAGNVGRTYVLSTRRNDGPRTTSRVSGGILATLTEIGSAGKSTVTEVRSRWFTPGIGDEPTVATTLFGSLEVGSAVLAVDDRGGILGTITAIRPAHPIRDSPAGDRSRPSADRRY